jgi:hypothetical protein
MVKTGAIPDDTTPDTTGSDQFIYTGDRAGDSFPQRDGAFGQVTRQFGTILLRTALSFDQSPVVANELQANS